MADLIERPDWKDYLALAVVAIGVGIVTFIFLNKGS